MTDLQTENCIYIEKKRRSSRSRRSEEPFSQEYDDGTRQREREREREREANDDYGEKRKETSRRDAFCYSSLGYNVLNTAVDAADDDALFPFIVLLSSSLT